MTTSVWPPADREVQDRSTRRDQGGLFGARPVYEAMLKTRVCTRCGKRKRVSLNPTESAFSRRRRGPADKPSGWLSQCKACIAEITRERERNCLVERRELVPIGPFAEWLRKEVAKHNYDCGYGSPDRGGIRVVADMVGVHESRIRVIIHEKQKQVTLKFVDHALVGLGSDTQLWELYPEYFDDE